MKKNITIEERIEKFKQVCIDRYNALYLEDDYKKGNNLEKQLIKQAQELIITAEGVGLLYNLLKNENEIVRYYCASIIFSLYPK